MKTRKTPQIERNWAIFAITLGLFTICVSLCFLFMGEPVRITLPIMQTTMLAGSILMGSGIIALAITNASGKSDKDAK